MERYKDLRKGTNCEGIKKSKGLKGQNKKEKKAKAKVSEEMLKWKCCCIAFLWSLRE